MTLTSNGVTIMAAERLIGAQLGRPPRRSGRAALRRARAPVASLAPALSDAPEHRIDDLLSSAERYAGVFTAGDLPVEPALKLAVVACMDSRIDLFALLGLHLGEAHIIRNAGGLVTDDVLRSLTLSQALLQTRQILVIQHTGCGLHGDEQQLRERVAKATGAEPPWPLGGFQDLDASVRRQLEILHSTPHLLGGDSARGFVYAVDTGRLREVR